METRLYTCRPNYDLRGVGGAAPRPDLTSGDKMPLEPGNYWSEMPNLNEASVQENLMQERN